MRLSCLTIIILLLGACSIPAEYVRSDGTLVVELVSHQVFRVKDHQYTTSNLGIALAQLSRSKTFQRVELYIPSKMLRKSRFSCQDYALAISASKREWVFYEWTPGHPETRVQTTCDFAVLALAPVRANYSSKPTADAAA